MSDVESTLRKYGYRQIVSDAEALKLLRRELKFHAMQQDRNPNHRVDCRYLLAIQCGNWFRLMRNNPYCSILIWRGDVQAEDQT